MMQLTSQIDRVKLYAAGATVSRVAQFHGRESHVEIPGLPLALDDSSVRVRLENERSPNSAIATDVRIGLAVPPHTQPVPFPDDAEIQVAQTEVNQLVELLDLIENEIKVLSYIKIPKRPNGDGENAPPASPTTMRMAIAHYKKEQIRDRTEEKRELEEKLRQAKEHLNDLVQKKARASSAKEARPNELRKIAIVRLNYQTLETDRPELPQRLILEYFVPGARWTPTYVCRLDTVANTATIAMRALICQRSGEDWTGVAIELSTAQPTMWCELPELPSLRLGRVQPPPKKSGWRRPPVGAELLFEDYDRQTPEALLQELVGKGDFASQSSSKEKLRSRSMPSAPPAAAPATALRTISADLDEYERLATVGLESVRLEFDADYSLEEPSEAFGDDQLEENAIEMEKKGATPKMSDRVFARMAPKSAESSPQRRRRRSESSLTRQQSVVQVPKKNRFLAYDLMEMGEIDNREKRGKLSVRDRKQTYLEILQRQDAMVDFDVISTVQEAISNAQQCLNRPLPSGGINVRQVAGSFDYAYRGQGRVDVPSDGEFHSVALTGQSTELDIYYVTVPRVAANVFRMAKLRNPLQSPLLTGPTDVYLDGEYLLSTTIQTVPPKGQMDLGLGVDESIKVARNTAYKENRGGNLLVGLNELHHEIKIELANNLSKEVKIEVRDRLPIPAKDAKVEVILDAVSPKWETYKQTERDAPIEGGYHWWVDLPGREQKTLSVQYTVKIAADSDLVGGNRREE